MYDKLFPVVPYSELPPVSRYGVAPEQRNVWVGTILIVCIVVAVLVLLFIKDGAPWHGTPFSS